MFKNLRELITTMPDERACRDYLVKQRWDDKPICPYCGCDKHYVIENGKRFKCGSKVCYKKFSVTIGTIFEASNIPLTKWLMAIYICSGHKKGISSYQLSRDLGIAQKSAWFMLHRIRYAFGNGSSDLRLNNDVQADEAFIGGSDVYRHKNKKKGQDEGKTAVLGLIETGGNVKTKVASGATKRNAGEFIEQTLNPGSRLISDTSPIYQKIGKRFEHLTINHTTGEFVINGFHTNGIENYWSVLKRGIYGIYHSVTAKHLQAYCDEFSFRFNSRKMKDSERFKMSLQKINGRLTYKTLIAKPDFIAGGMDIATISED